MTLNLDKSAWKRVTFGEVIENVTDRVDDPSKAGVGRYVGLEHLDPGNMRVQRWDSPDKVEAQKLRFQPGDVIFGRRRAYQKKVAQADFEGICSAHALVLRARPDYIHPDFLPVFLSSDYFLDRAVAISVGSLSPTVNWRDLKVQEFDLPPLDEQKRVADLLWAIEQQRSQLEVVRQGHHSLLQVCLVHTLFRGGPAETTTVGDIAIIKHGFAFSGDSFSTDVAYPTVVTPGNFAIGGGFQESPPKTFVGEYLEEFLLSAGDVIVTMTDLSKAGDTLGYSAIVPEDGTYLHNQRIGKVVLNPDAAVLAHFLAWVFRTKHYREYILRTATGSTVRHTSPSRIESYEFPLPSLSAQSSALEEVSQLVESKSSIDRELNSLWTLRNTILAEIFGGS